MDELIRVTTGEQGSPVVSARELWQFLGVKKQFADWIKNRLEKYDLADGADYTTFSLIGEKGRPTTEYALTLNAAKELAMVEGNAKGKQARQYFIAKEEQLRQVLQAPTTEQALIQLIAQSNQLLANQQQLLNDLRADVDGLRNERAQLSAPTLPPTVKGGGKQLGLPGIPVRLLVASSLRQAINRYISDYSAYNGVAVHQTYSYLYKRMFEVYSISVHRLNRSPTENIMDVLERYGQLNNLYALVTAELIYPHE